MTEMETYPAVTFLVGENGAGKSILLEAIAIASGFDAKDGSRGVDPEEHLARAQAARKKREP
jgi:predicted ATPase